MHWFTPFLTLNFQNNLINELIVQKSDRLASFTQSGTREGLKLQSELNMIRTD